MKTNDSSLPAASDLRRRAERRLAAERRGGRSPSLADPRPADEAMRLVHELQVHQVELEMQNTELAEARDRLETLVEKYTDLYDFAPIGYFSLDQRGRILEVNLTGAALLGVERASVLGSSLSRFVTDVSRPAFQSFVDGVFSTGRSQSCELSLSKPGGPAYWASLQGTMVMATDDRLRSCRVAVSDINALVQAREAQRRVDSLSAANRELTAEIARRKVVERALKDSQLKQSRLLQESRTLQHQLRHISHQILRAQEEERKRISRELHDEVSQMLVNIHVQLETLLRKAAVNPGDLPVRIAKTQRLLVEAVDAIHAFAGELRPPQLDDLGLIPSLQSLLKEFTEHTGVGVDFASFAGVERLSSARRTVLYRVAQSALSNVAKHTRARQVTLHIKQSPGAVCMEIADNGRGFDVHRALHPKRGMRLGLLGMRERVEMVGGRFSVASSPGKGTRVYAEIPNSI